MRNEQYNSFTEGKEVSFIKGKESYSSFLVPDFVDIQRKSFFRLLEKGISEEFSKINPIVSDISRLNLAFYPEKFLLILPNFSVSEAILQGKTYSCKLYVPATLSGQNTKFSALARGRSKSFGSMGKRVLEASERVLEGPRPKRLQPLGPLGVGAPLRAKGPLSNTEPLSWVLLGNLPLMTKRGHFVINGSPRVLVNQLTRCPGIYFHERKWGIGKMARRIVYADFVSRRGAWLRLQADKTGEVWARLKRTPKIPFFLFYESMVASERPPFQWTFSDQAALIEMYEEVNPTKRESSAQGGKAFLDQKFRNPRTYDLGSTGRNQLNMRFGGSLISRQLTSKDLYYAFEQIKALHNHRIFADDIDNLSNRRVRAAGDLVQGQFETGLYRLEKAVVAKMRKSLADASCKTLVTTKSLNGALREFFGSSPLSQYMDQTNPLAEITQKRRISSLGPGGISRETAGMAIRGIHSTHYGRICPIETPEGKNAGLVNSLTVFTQIRKDGTLESPYYPILQGQVQNEFGFKFLAVEAEEQGFTKIAPGDINTSSSRFLPSNSIPIREAGNPQKDFRYASRETVNYIAVSPIQMISIATSLIPFLEHDDANRALMGSNMQRQAVPLLRAERPVVGTGLEALVIAASGHALSSRTSGYVSSVSNKKVVIYSKPLSFTKGKQVSPVLREKRWEASQMALEASKMVLEGPRHKGHKPFGPLALLAMQKPQVATSLVYQKSAGESLRGRRPERVKPLGSGPLQHHLRLLQEPKRFPKLFEKTGLSCIATTYFGLFEGPQDEKVLTRRSFCIANNLRRASSRNGVGGALSIASNATTQGATKFREAVGRGPLDHPSFTKIEREGPSNPYPNNEPISMSLAQSSVQDMESGLTPIGCNLQSVRENYIIKQKAYIFGEVGSLKKQGLQSIKPKATGTSFTSDFCFTFREKRVAFVNRCQLVLFHSQREGLGGMTDGVGGALSIASNATTQEASTSLHFVNKMDKAFTIASNAITPRGRYFTRKSLSEQSLNFISQLRHYPLTHSIKNWLSYRSSLDCLEGLQFKEPKKIWATTVDNKNQNLKVSGFTDNHKTNQRRGLFGRLGYTSPFTMPQRTLGAPLRLERTTYSLQSYCRSNQETCLNHIPAVSEGEWVQEGDLVADCSASQFGELALGKNVLIAYLPWEGYNFEDAVVISERLVLEDVYTSIHIQKYEVETKETKFGFERITPDVPGLLEEQRGRLDEHGIAKIGSWVREGDILVGKASPKGVQLLSPYERLAYDIANVEAAKMEDTSLRVPKGVEGRVVNYHAYQEGSSLMHVFEPSLSGKGAVGGALSIASNATTQEDGKQSKKVLIGELNHVRIYLAEERRIQVGDKVAGRHGNKGIVSTILPRQDMPYLPDGQIVDVVLNPLGIPSRMNVGQVFECLLGLAGMQLGQHFQVTPFDEIYGAEASRSLVYLKLYQARLRTNQNWIFDFKFPGKVALFDGRSGHLFDQWVTVGYAYMLKLVHLVDEKIHARSTGPYSLVTKQPLGGRSKHGGQRLGEMEVWALEGFGAAYILQEMLTSKSDDVVGRKQAVEAILFKGKMSLGNPEAFKVLVRELQALCLDVGVYAISSLRLQREAIDVGTIL